MEMFSAAASGTATRGYEVLVSRPEVIYKTSPEGRLLAPIEKLFVEVHQEHLSGTREGK